MSSPRIELPRFWPTLTIKSGSMDVEGRSTEVRVPCMVMHGMSVKGNAFKAFADSFVRQYSHYVHIAKNGASQEYLRELRRFYMTYLLTWTVKRMSTQGPVLCTSPQLWISGKSFGSCN